MGKIILLIGLLLISICANAQIADTQFGESQESVLQKLTNRFGYPDEGDYDDIHITYWNKSYAGHNWDYINFDFKTDSVGYTHLEYNCLTKDFITLESAKKYLVNLKSSLSYSFTQAKKEDNVLFSYEAHENNTVINLYIFYNRKEKKKYTVWLTYEAESIEYKEQDLNSSIMDTNMGDSYEEVESKLYSKYGVEEDKDRRGIIYKDVVFAGIKWNAAFFTFEYTTSTSHLNCIMLTKGCFTSEDAKNLRDKILHEKIGPQKWQYKINDDGFKMYHIDMEDKEMYIMISKSKLGYSYDVNFIEQSKLYTSEDKL